MGCNSGFGHAVVLPLNWAAGMDDRVGLDVLELVGEPAGHGTGLFKTHWRQGCGLQAPAHRLAGLCRPAGNDDTQPGLLRQALRQPSSKKAVASNDKNAQRPESQ